MPRHVLGPTALLVLAAAAASAPARAADGASASRPFSLSSAARLGANWGTVTSTFRTPAHNRAVGGVPNSFHLVGRAVDIARKAGVSHATIEAAFRRAGFRLVESLDEGDHSHFAFADADSPATAQKHRRTKLRVAYRPLPMAARDAAAGR